MLQDLLPAIELATNHDPLGSVIWMHGLGADGNDFVPVVRELDLADDKPLRFIFPHAPTRPVTLNGGMVMRAWYDMEIVQSSPIILPGQPSRPAMRGSETDIRASQRAVERLIEREVSRGVASEKIVLAGFSQGGVIALQTGLRHVARLGGILALSTYLALEDTPATQKSAANAAIPIFMAHGTQDEVIPLALGKRSRDILQREGCQVEWHEYPTPHSVMLEEIQAISAWLQKIV